MQESWLSRDAGELVVFADDIFGVVFAGKATAITVGGLVAGAVLGGLVESWLRVDIVPVLGIGSPAAVVSEFVLVSLWLSSLYLR